MKLSIIIPVYNVEKYLSDCLDSVVNQQVEDIEIICVNDGSTDSSLDILREYENKYNFIYIYSKSNGGLSSARNYGIEKAKGEYLFFLDSDDILADDKCLSFMIDTMEKEKLDVLYFDGKSFFEDESIYQRNKSYDTAYQRKKSYGIYQYGRNLFADFINNSEYYVQTSLQCLRKDFIKKNDLKFPDGILYEDNLFMFKGMLLANKVIHKNRIVMLHRIRKGSIIQSGLKFHNFYSLFSIYQEMLQFWKCNKQEIEVDEEILITVNSIKYFAKSVFYKLNIKEKENIFKLSKYDQYLIKNILEINIKENSNNLLFPYYLFYVGCRIVIYGAGNVGKAFYYDAIKNRAVNIIGIVDSNAAKMEKNDIPVLPSSEIKQLQYDFILIAVENPKIAEEIKSQLIEMGVPEYKLRWDNTVYFKNNIQRIYEYYKFTDRLIEVNNKRIFLLMLPEHGNLGDHAIAIAEEKFLKQYFSDYKVIAITTNEFWNLENYIINKIQSDDIILFHGGGFIGDLWGSGQVFKKLVKIFSNNIKIILPNSLAYKKDYEEGYDITTEDLIQLHQDQKLFILFRDRKSYEFYQKCGYKERCFYFPDMAMFLSLGKMSLSSHQRDKKIILCFRHDEEKIFMNEEYIKKTLNKLRLKYEEKDTHVNQYIPKYEEVAYLRNLINAIQSSSLVITDRLHGMILSAICGTPCIAFDNSTHKVFSVYEWLKKRENIILCSAKELNQLPELINLALSIGHVEYEPMLDEFEKMAKLIRTISSKSE